MILLTTCLMGYAGDTTHEVGVGAYMHSDHSVFTDLPFGDDEFSYGICYNYHNDEAYWQIALDYAFDLEGSSTADYALTPQLNLIAKDGNWIGGVGILDTYIADEIAGDEWTDLYWQLIFGYNLALGSIDLSISVNYVYESWEDIADFDIEDLEYCAWLKYEF